MMTQPGAGYKGQAQGPRSLEELLGSLLRMKFLKMASRYPLLL